MIPLKKAYNIRYFIFLAAIVLFLILPSLFEEPSRSLIVFPIAQAIVLLAGIILLQKSRLGIWFISFLAVMAIVLRWLTLNTDFIFFGTLSIVLNVMFLLLVGYEIFGNLLNVKRAIPHTIVGAFNGYILLGIAGFYMLLLVESYYPASFSNLSIEFLNYGDLIYFSFITIAHIERTLS